MEETGKVVTGIKPITSLFWVSACLPLEDGTLPTYGWQQNSGELVIRGKILISRPNLSIF